MQIGIGTYSFGGLQVFLNIGMPLKEKFELIRSLGLDSVELLAVDLEVNTPEYIRECMKETGIRVTSVHAMPTEENIRRIAAVGGQACICPMAAFNNAAEAKELAAELEQYADLADELGVKIGYHNHNQEFYFTEGKTLLEHLMDNSTRLYLQLDCGWCTAGGGYAPSVIRKYRNRIAAIHVKENEKVIGPGPKPASRHDANPNPFADIDITKMTLEERKALYEEITSKEDLGSGHDEKTKIQCPMGAPSSNIDWMEIKKALDEQDFEAFWVIEREYFYDEHDKCIAEDCKWLREHIENA